MRVNVTVRPHNNNNNEYFLLSNNERNAVEWLTKAMLAGEGIYNFYGSRGVGKTSLLNFSIKIAKSDIKYREQNNLLLIHIPLYTTQEELYKEIIGCLIDAIDTGNIGNSYSEDVFELRYLFFGEVTKENQLSSEDTSLNQLDIINSKESNFEAEASLKGKVRFLKRLKAQAGSKVKGSKKNKKTNQKIENSKQSEATHQKMIELVTFPQKIDKLVRLFNKLSQDNKCVLVIDELDKLSKEVASSIILENKNLLLNTSLTTILISDFAIGSHLNEALSDYLTVSHFQKSLSFNDFLVKVSNYSDVDRHLNHDIKSLLTQYGMCQGNNRKLINSIINEERYSFSKSEQSYYLFLFQHSLFYKELPVSFKDIASQYVMACLRNLEIIKVLKLEDLDKLRNQFLSQRELTNPVLTMLLVRLEEVFKNGLILSKDCFFFQNQTQLFGMNHEPLQSLFTSFSILETSLYNVETEGLMYSQLEQISREFEKSMAIFVEKSDYVDSEEMVIDWKKNAGLKLINYTLSDYKKVPFIKRLKSPSTDKAKNIVMTRANQILGVVIYKMKNNESSNPERLIQGYIFQLNDTGDLTAYALTGYPGLTSHKPNEVVDLICICREQGTPLIEPTEDYSDNYELRNAKDCERTRIILREWLEELELKI